MEGIVEGPAPSLRVGPWFLVKNSLFASCGGPLKSVGSIVVTGLVVPWVLPASPAHLKRVGLYLISLFAQDRPAFALSPSPNGPGPYPLYRTGY